MFIENSPIQQIVHPDITEYGVELWMKRDDLIHPEVSGNKWRKLKHYVEKAKGRDGIVTFGGAYSNHIAATAAVGKLLGIETIGIIRGDELEPSSNPTLSKAHADGMKLLFVTREEYGFRDQLAYHKQIKQEYGNVVVMPEGGAGYEGIVGATEIMKEQDDFDLVAVSCGTGTTLTGILISLGTHQHVMGFSALKGVRIEEEVRRMIGDYFLDKSIEDDYQDGYSIFDEYHFGGYAKVDAELIDFMRSFYKHTNIKLDPVYTGKMMFGLIDQIKKNKELRGKKILAIHTGGIQGIQGVEAKLGQLIY